MPRIIRASGTRPRVVPREIAAARADAERLIAEARREAARIVDDAEQRIAARCERTAHEAREAAEADVLARLFDAVEARERNLADARHDVARLAVAAARRLLHAELELDPARIRHIVHDVLQRARRARHVTVRAHPDDIDALRASARETRGPAMELEADARIERGGCVVATEAGELDARVEVRVAALARALGGDTER